MSVLERGRSPLLDTGNGVCMYVCTTAAAVCVAAYWRKDAPPQKKNGMARHRHPSEYKEGQNYTNLVEPIYVWYSHSTAPFRRTPPPGALLLSTEK